LGSEENSETQEDCKAFFALYSREWGLGKTFFFGMIGSILNSKGVHADVDAVICNIRSRIRKEQILLLDICGHIHTIVLLIAFSWSLQLLSVVIICYLHIK